MRLLNCWSFVPEVVKNYKERHTPVVVLLHETAILSHAHLGILKRALIGFSPKSGGVLSAISIAVIPRDQTSARLS